MRKISVRSLAACISMLVMAGSPVVAEELTAAQIVEKNVAARGGLDAWKNIQSMVWVGHIERGSASTTSLPFVLEMKRPNKTRFEIKAQNQTAVRAYDGNQGWKQRMANGNKPELQPYTNEELRFAADAQGIDGPLVDYQAKGIAVALGGIDEIEGRKAYRLKVRFPSGASRNIWIDAQSFLDVKYDREFRNGPGQSGTMSVFYRNYQKIGDLQIPLVIENGTNTVQIIDRMVIDRVLLNPPLSDVVFAKPSLPGRSNTIAVESPRQVAGPARILRPRSFSGREAQ